MKKLLSSIFIAATFLFLAYGSESSSTSNTSPSEQSNAENNGKKKCAVISTDKPESYPVRCCRSEFSSDKAWEDKIEWLKGKKKYDEVGHEYTVTVTYE